MFLLCFRNLTILNICVFSEPEAIRVFIFLVSNPFLNFSDELVLCFPCHGCCFCLQKHNPWRTLEHTLLWERHFCTSARQNSGLLGVYAWSLLWVRRAFSSAWTSALGFNWVCFAVPGPCCGGDLLLLLHLQVLSGSSSQAEFEASDGCTSSFSGSCWNFSLVLCCLSVELLLQFVLCQLVLF